MDPRLNLTRVAEENAADASPDRITEATRRFGFRPAFLDCVRMRIHLARFADGRLAPFHLLEGLPDEAVADRSAAGRVVRAKATLIPGFERGGFFYTRTAAARACMEWGSRN